MGRRSDHSREQLSAMVLASAGKIVAQKGLAGLNVRNVATDIGYSVGTIYNLFKSQADLVLHLNGQTCDDLYAHLQAASQPKEPAKAIKALVAAYLAFVEANPKRWSALFEHVMPEDDPLPDWFLEKVNKPMGLLEDALAPLFGPKDQARLMMSARILWSGVHGICSLAMGNKLDILTDKPVKAVTDQFVDDYLKGLKAG